MQVLLTPTGPIPAWASRCKGSVGRPQGLQARPEALRRRSCAPSARATRPSSTGRSGTSRTSRSWLSPQYEVVGRASPSSARPRCTARSRRRRSPALRATGHRTTTDQIWLGETAPLGDDPSGCSAQRSAARAQELRDARSSRPRRRRSCAACSACPRAAARSAAPKARTSSCKGYKKLGINGYAHHPYTRGGSRPPLSKTQRRRDHDQRRLAADQAARPGRQAQADPDQAAGPLHRARLADQPARRDRHLRRDRRPAVRVHQPVRLDRVQQPARANRRAVQDRRRREHRRRLPDGPAAVQRRRAQAGLRRLQAADLGASARAPT